MSCAWHETKWTFKKKDSDQMFQTISVEQAADIGNDPEWEFLWKECYGPRFETPRWPIE